MAVNDTEQNTEIQSAYEAMGLGTPAARAQFVPWFTADRPKAQFDVVISTTSNPRI